MCRSSTAARFDVAPITARLAAAAGEVHAARDITLDMRQQSRRCRRPAATMPDRGDAMRAAARCTATGTRWARSVLAYSSSPLRVMALG